MAMIDGTLHFIPLKTSKVGENALTRWSWVNANPAPAAL
jgi:hypothetical protein